MSIITAKEESRGMGLRRGWAPELRRASSGVLKKRGSAGGRQRRKKNLGKRGVPDEKIGKGCSLPILWSAESQERPSAWQLSSKKNRVWVEEDW